MKVIQSDPIADLYEKWVPAKQVAIADKLIKLKHDNQTNVWAVVDEVINLWVKLRPKDYKSFIIDTESVRNAQINKFGSNKAKNIRHSVDCPQFVHDVLRRLYDPDELQMNKEFFEKFWHRYPVFRISQKI